MRHAGNPAWERWATLAPVFVVGVGLVAAVLILLGRAFADSVRDVQHKRLIWLGAAALVGVVVLLTYLGVKLPRSRQRRAAAGPAAGVRLACRESERCPASSVPSILDGAEALDDRPCPAGEVRALAEELGVDRRRSPRSSSGAATATRPRRARSSRARCPATTRFALGDMAEAVERIRAAIAAGKRICVHGDYDADGICATALAVFLLRELGADPGLAPPLPLRGGLRARRADARASSPPTAIELVLTVDCGITAVAEVEEAARLGLEVIVTDHHRPGDVPRLPGRRAAARATTPSPGSAAPASSGSSPRRSSAPEHPFLERHLDVVALATVADVVPLLDESRALALAGLRRLAQTQKPGLQALMRVAGVDPAACDESAIGFRLAPRINAAGRLGRPEAALALLLTADPVEARRLAEQLEELNRERQAVEERILRAAARPRSRPGRKQRRRRRGYVVAGEDWHEGVIGIVASRLVERFGRPVVLIAGSASGGDWKGSGRAPGALRPARRRSRACAEHLERFGGHRAAAGLSIRPENVDAFAEAFAAYADSRPRRRRPPAERSPSTRSSQGSALGLPLAQELARLAPFGLGNPGVTLLVDGCELAASTRSGRASTSASASASAAATPVRRSPSGSAPSSTASAASAATTSPSGCRRTAGTAPSRRSSSSAASSTPTSATRSCAPGSPSSGGAARQRRGRPRRRQSSTSSSWPRAAGGACSSRRPSGGSLLEAPPALARAA